MNVGSKPVHEISVLCVLDYKIFKYMVIPTQSLILFEDSIKFKFQSN